MHDILNGIGAQNVSTFLKGGGSEKCYPLPMGDGVCNKFRIHILPHVVAKHQYIRPQ